MKQTRSLLWTFLFVIALTVPATAANETLNNFTGKNFYYQNQFKDVPTTMWYNANVEKVYELGLMLGNSATTFGPNENITEAQALAITARIHKIYTTGSDNFSDIKQEMDGLRPTILAWCGNENNPAYKEFYEAWYAPYVYYLYSRVWPEGRAIYPQFPALAYEPIHAPFIDAQTPISRAKFVSYLFGALPESELQQLNDVENGAIPDVTYAESPETYLLYRAGVLTGNDSQGTFAPETYITRAHVAAIVGRMVDPSLRKTIILKDTQSRSDMITLSASKLNIAEPTTIMVDVYYDDADYPDGISLNADYDSSVVDIEWGDWDGWTIPLKIIPVQNGQATVKISLIENPNEFQDINVIVGSGSGYIAPPPESENVCSHYWIEATCTKPRECSICNITEGIALGHAVVIDKAVEATSTRTGLTEGKHCARCGEVLVPQQIIPKDDTLIENTTFELTNDLSQEYSYVASELYTRCKIDSVDYTVSPTYNENIILKITLLLQKTVQGETSNNNIKLHYTLHRDGVAVQSRDITIINTELDTLYEHTISYTGAAGDYTLTCKSVRY